MRNSLLIMACLVVGGAHAESTWLADLLAGYARIETVSCDVRRDVSNQDGDIRWLSRVLFQQPDRLHVENFSPLPRRIIADGAVMYQHNEGHPRGFRRAINDLDETMLLNLRRVPGTLMEHLLRLQQVDEIVLSREDDGSVLRAYKVDDVYVVIQADERDRLTEIRFYAGPDREQLTGSVICTHFEEVLDGVWIAMRHQVEVTAVGVTTRERVRFSNYEVNVDIPDRLFDADLFFDGVRWVDRFDRL